MSGSSLRYGYFNQQARAYMINDPRILVIWINYIDMRQFGGFVPTLDKPQRFKCGFGLGCLKVA